METVVAPGTIQETILRLLLATLLGAAVGVDREFQDKPAGVRTHALVALGAALATLVSVLLAQSNGTIDPNAASRVLQGILAGVGFVGAGVILHRDDTNKVHGLTTAASIWIVATIGIAAGVGLWRLGVAATVIVLILLLAERPVARLFKARKRRQGRSEPDGEF
jgi:putative Mg2+ transporter-C (MgtC) family protein